METIKVTIDGKEFRMFKITVFKGTENEQEILVAEEALNTTIEKLIENERYHEVKDIDRKYCYYVPQEIADDEIEFEIVDSIESVMIEDLYDIPHLKNGKLISGHPLPNEDMECSLAII